MKTYLSLVALTLLVLGCSRVAEPTWSLNSVSETSEYVRRADGYETTRIVLAASIAHSATYQYPVGVKIIVKDPKTGKLITDFREWPSYALGTDDARTNTTVYIYIPKSELDLRGELEVHAIISSKGIGSIPIVRTLKKA